ncbi:MAG TPA: PIN domain-containing protein [Salinimicrobium sp.]|nr:PIN domain-containing protein [Salinimicrobium sp.]
MIVVIDTNIVFSAILSPNGTICDLLLNSTKIFEFYAPGALLDELDFHHQKLLKLSGLTEAEINFLKRTIMKKIDLIDLETIRPVVWQNALELTRDVDEFDTPFVALSIELGFTTLDRRQKTYKGIRTKRNRLDLKHRYD